MRHSRYPFLFLSTVAADALATLCWHSVSHGQIILATLATFLMPWVNLFAMTCLIDAKTRRERLTVTFCVATACALATAGTLWVMQ